MYTQSVYICLSARFLKTVEGTCWVVKIGAISGIRKERVRSFRVLNKWPACCETPMKHPNPNAKAHKPQNPKQTPKCTAQRLETKT